MEDSIKKVEAEVKEIQVSGIDPGQVTPEVGEEIWNSNKTKLTVLIAEGGPTVSIKVGKGRHAMKAQLIADGDNSKLIPAMMSLLTEVDGKILVLEDYEDMPLPQYMTIMGLFNDVNFLE